MSSRLTGDLYADNLIAQIKRLERRVVTLERQLLSTETAITQGVYVSEVTGEDEAQADAPRWRLTVEYINGKPMLVGTRLENEQQQAQAIASGR